MPRYYAVTLEDLAHARVAYERGEPRDLFYRVAQALMADAEAGRGPFSGNDHVKRPHRDHESWPHP